MDIKNIKINGKADKKNQCADRVEVIDILPSFNLVNLGFKLKALGFNLVN